MCHVQSFAAEAAAAQAATRHVHTLSSTASGMAPGAASPGGGRAPNSSSSGRLRNLQPFSPGATPVLPEHRSGAATNGTAAHHRFGDSEDEGARHVSALALANQYVLMYFSRQEHSSCVSVLSGVRKSHVDAHFQAQSVHLNGGRVPVDLQ